MKRILLSIGKPKNKQALLPFIKQVPLEKFDIYATDKTSKFLTKHKIRNTLIYKVSESSHKPNLADFLIRGDFDLIINISTKDTHKIADTEYTNAQYIRRKAVENNITLVTDVEVAGLYLKSLGKDLKLTNPRNSHIIPPSNPFTAYYNPLYYIEKSYDFNYEFGPFFCGVYPPKQKQQKKKLFLGFEVNSLFGVPAGPLINSTWVETYAKLGFDILTYKTVRTVSKACHQPPNVVFIDPQRDYNYDFDKPAYSNGDKVVPYNQISITNSFGVPSKEPDVWQEDIRRLLLKLKKGQLLILSVMGTVEKGMTEDDLVNDFVNCALMGKDTGVKAIEINLSCPNLGTGAICNDLETSKKIIKGVNQAIGETPLLVKISFLNDSKYLEKFVVETNEYVDCYVAINTIPKKVLTPDGKQTLKGKKRLISGTCGAVIKQAGLEVVTNLNKIRAKRKLNYKIIGIGGVMTPNDYFSYLDAGADAVQSATGAMWNPYLAYQIRNADQQPSVK